MARVFTRRRVLTGIGVAVAAVGAGVYWVARPKSAPIGFSVSPDELAAARALLTRHPSFDAHAHPGRSFVAGAENLSGLVWIYAKLGSFEDKTIADMRAGGLSAAAFAAVADFQALGLEGEGLAAARAFEPGEAWASYKRQIGRMQALATRGLVFPIKAVADVATARAARKVGAWLTVEGGDFLEGRPERVAEAFADGVRSITLMHYRNNELGFIITDTQAQGGISDQGIAVVRAMNAVGMLVDVAHASEPTARGAIDASSQPVIASHIHVQGATSHPRFISRALWRVPWWTGAVASLEPGRRVSASRTWLAISGALWSWSRWSELTMSAWEPTWTPITNRYSIPMRTCPISWPD